MKIYLVGGAVRDKLLNLPVSERDYVVVGASVKDMLTQGYQQVGKEFPVFLHPQTREEYALARMERKTSPGYTGFQFDTSAHVTLEEDLLRRDLTINAMAEDETGHIIDPFHGQDDLKNKILRHVSPAFTEDPVRILRIARFLARYQHFGFKVADKTLALMQEMVASGEINALVPERVWKELERALGEQSPAAFFDILQTSHALPILFPEFKPENRAVLIQAAALTPDPTIRFAALFYNSPEQDIKHLCKRYRVPNFYRELTLLTSRHHANMLNLTRAEKPSQATPTEILNLFYALDVFRRETRFGYFIEICRVIANHQQIRFTPAWLLDALEKMKAIDVQKLIQQGLKDREIADALHKERLAILQAL